MKEFQKLQQGFTEVLSEGAKLLVRWRDNSVVTVASNVENDYTELPVGWNKERKANDYLQQPQIIHFYNQLMGGVDLHDLEANINAVPCITVINGPLKPGKIFIIRGVISTYPKRIQFNLRHRFGIAFHFNPRFDENRILCSTWDGNWGKEEFHGSMPFKPGQPFEVKIYCTDSGYSVSVDGHQMYTYKHRLMELYKIDVLDIRGDLQLTSVEA
ncbi:Galectin-5 [Triplophysa tibetana]|uniref:Galectin n=1 Tax=Triplophysa tibetana TaxID=1572043 RepID=A0A5A9MZ34_9TELE|nr:Galectin-5 [Triplophysa tibetana]